MYEYPWHNCTKFYYILYLTLNFWPLSHFRQQNLILPVSSQGSILCSLEDKGHANRRSGTDFVCVQGSDSSEYNSTKFLKAHRHRINTTKLNKFSEQAPPTSQFSRTSRYHQCAFCALEDRTYLDFCASTGSLKTMLRNSLCALLGHAKKS